MRGIPGIRRGHHRHAAPAFRHRGPDPAAGPAGGPGPDRGVGRLDNGSALLTGVVVARADFVKEHPAAVSNFLEQYSASVDWVNANTADAAALIGEYSIVDAPSRKRHCPTARPTKCPSWCAPPAFRRSCS